MAIHRWLEGTGQDVVIVASLSETTHYNYPIGLPYAGNWREAFNSDVYDHWVNPWVTGNGDRSTRTVPLHGFQSSAALVIPANSVLLFSAPSGS
jgi:1,4-alpha-glucan branching enzyme